MSGRPGNDGSASGATGDHGEDVAPTADEDPPGTAMRVGYAVAYFLVLGFSVGQATTAVASAVLVAPGLGVTTTIGTLVTAAVAGLLSGVREPPSVGPVIVYSLVAAGLGYGLGPLLGSGVGDLRGSGYVAVETALVWLAALLLAYVPVFGVDWATLRDRYAPERFGD